MKTYWLLIVIAIACVTAKAQEISALSSPSENRIVAFNDLEKRDNLYYYDSETIPFTGVYRANYESGKIKREITYENGVETKTVEWYENGQKMSENFYHNAISIGTATSWYENGQKKAENTYENGEEVKRLEWFDNCKPKVECYFKNGKKNGLWIEWYENGRKKIEGEYRNDEKVGTWRKYFSSGSLDKERVFLK